MNDTTTQRLERLLGYLTSDPANAELYIDAIQAALDAGELGQAEQLVSDLAARAPHRMESQYFGGLILMKQRRFDDAASRFGDLLETEDTPAVRFNLAWSRAMIGAKAEAMDVLDARTVSSIGAAAMLKTQLMHEAGDFDGAAEFGREALERFPDDTGLNAAMATLALDIEDVDLARRCSEKAGPHPEALAARGVISLSDGDLAEAAAAFDRSIAIREFNPRAWLGRGLVDLVQHDPQSAGRSLDRGAEQFGDHIGSWLAAGWAYYLAGDVDQARTRFARAQSLDPAFAETQGSLAVVDIAAGDIAGARHRIGAALKLDRTCFSAALAQVLLSSDDPEKSRAIVQKAFDTPLNDRGMTVASYLAGLKRPTLH